MKHFEQYYYNGKVSLPKSIRYYVDFGCYEYENMPMDDKVLDMAFVLSHGGDVVSEIKEMLKNHPEYNEDHMKIGLLMMLHYIRIGEDVNLFGLEEIMSLNEIVSLLKYELTLRYIYNDESGFYELKTFHVDYSGMLKGKDREERIAILSKPMVDGLHLTMNELKIMNPWSYFITPLLYCNPLKIRYDGEQMVCAGDRSVVDTYNQRNGSKFPMVTDIPPEPFRGNLINPKLVILSLNPGYVERLNGQLVNMLNEENTRSFLKALDDNLKINESKIVFNEIDNIIGDGYWVRMFSKIKEDLHDTDNECLRKAALVQYIPYASVKIENWNDELYRLSSQNFTRQLIRHILYENKDCVFLLMRAVKHWQSLIGMEMEQFKERFIYGDNPQVQKISEGNLGKENYNRILENLR